MQAFSRGNTVGSLTQLQHEVLVGSLLGDGTLRRQGNRNALLEVNHCYAQQAYVDWKYGVFSSISHSPPTRRLGNGQRVAYRFTTRSMPVLTKYHDWFYRVAKKIIPNDIELSALGLAVWYMDDGSKSRSSCYLNTQQFQFTDQKRLIELLWKTFRIEGRLNRDKQYQRIRVTTEGTQILHRFVEPFVLPCFRYKLCHDPVTTDPKGKTPTTKG